MRPLFHRKQLWVYPLFAGIGGSFGYWLMGVEQRQQAFMQEKMDALKAKRKRQAERNAEANGAVEDPTGLAQKVKDAVARSGMGGEDEGES